MALLENKILTVRELFSRPLLLPDYCVPFSWEEERAVRLLNDVVLNIKRGDYRLGTMVTVKKGEEHYILDGEGRFITLSIILTLLGSSLAPRFSRKWSKAERQQIKRVSVALEKSLSFVDKVSLNDFLLNGCSLVFIAVEEEEEAFFFFDSAISRGRALDPADLLKAYHLCAMREESEEVKAQAIASWERLDNEHLYSLFDTLYVLKRWLHKEVAVSFKADGLAVFKGLNSEEYPYLYSLSNKAFSLFDPILNGKRFFKMTEFYSNIYPDKLTEEIKKVYPNLEHNFRALKGYDNVGDLCAYKLFLTLLLLYVDRFGYTDFRVVVKACFCFAFALRFDNPGFSWSVVNDYILDSNGFFHTLEYAKTPYEVYSFDFPSMYPDLRNEVHPEHGRIKKLNWENDFALYLGPEL